MTEGSQPSCRSTLAIDQSRRILNNSIRKRRGNVESRVGGKESSIANEGQDREREEPSPVVERLEHTFSP
jgi:hypothetical protein